MISFEADQRFIVTGASSGIGEGVALLLNELGASVIGIGRDAKRLAAMKAKAHCPQNVFLERKDLTEDLASLPGYLKMLKEKYGKFQGLVHCAGMGGVRPLKVIDARYLAKLYAIDCFAPALLAKGFADRRINNGPGSAMVFIASRASVRPDPGMSAYAGAKAALVATMQSVAKELAPSGVRVNCISPALVETKMADATLRKFAEGKYPLGLGQVSDVAGMVAYLLSPAACRISGQNYVMDGAMA